jgi:RNA polymerase sigma-70 factor, ECF subfamily
MDLVWRGKRAVARTDTTHEKAARVDESVKGLAEELDDERTLVELFLRRRDEPAFRALYRRHAAALFGLAVRLAGGRGRDAEEIVQETWMRAASALGSFRWASSLRTWLCGIVINLWKERARRAAAEPFGPLLEEAVQPADPAPGERIDLERQIARLPDGYREVLVLHDVEGYTHEEIGRLLGIQAGTSKSQLSRARAALQRALAGCVAPKEERK